MDESCKRTIGVMAAIMASLHMRTADDLFGGPQDGQVDRRELFNGLRKSWRRLIICTHDDGDSSNN